MKSWIIFYSHIYKRREEDGSNKEDIQYAEEKHGMELQIFDATKFTINVTTGSVTLFYEDKIINDFPDFVLMKSSNEDLKYFFETKKIKYTNDIASTMLTSNKMATHISLSETNVKMPQTIFMHSLDSNNRDFNKIVRSLGKPFVLKGLKGRCGTMVHLINNEKEFNQLMKEYECNCMFQEFIQSKDAKGAHIRVTVVAKKAIDAEIIKNNNDFRSNMYLGGNSSSYELNNELKELSEEITKKLGLWTSGIDYIIDEKNDIYLLEVNSVPGYDDREALAYKNIIDLIAEDIK